MDVINKNSFYKNSPSQALILSLFCLWVFNDATGPKGVPNASILFLVITVGSLAALGICAYEKKHLFKVKKYEIFILICVLSLIPFGFLSYPIFNFRSGYHALSDLSTIAFLSLLIVLGIVDKQIYEGRYVVTFFPVILFFVAILSPVFGLFNIRPNYFWNYRYDPPHYFLFAFSGVILSFFPRRKKIKNLIYFSILVGLSLFSGKRSALVLALVLFFVPIFFSFSRKFKILIVSFFVFIAVGELTGVLSLRSFVFENLLHETRFSELSDGEDASMLGRFNEVRDVLDTISMEESIPLFLFGHGHGSTWRPYYAFPEMNILEDGRVHNIHIGPFAFLYRNGLVGLVLYLVPLVLLFKDLELFKYNLCLRINPNFCIFYITTIGVVLNSLLRNMLNDPLAEFCLIGYLFTRKKAIFEYYFQKNKSYFITKS